MATSSATGCHFLDSTPEKVNYMRLVRLLIIGGTELLRAVLDTFYPPSRLGNKLTESTIKDSLKKTLIQKQRDIVYPAPGVCGESKDFDICLLSKLLKAICAKHLPPLPTGWDRLPKKADLSWTADIVRIKQYRNDIVHKYHTLEIGDAEFCSLWNEIKMALLRIALHINAATRQTWEKAIENLLQDPLTPEAERNVKELQEWYRNDKDAKECIEEGIARVERQIERVEFASAEESQRVNERFDRLEETLARGIQGLGNQLREVLTNRAASRSGEAGASLRIIIDIESIVGRRSQEVPSSLHSQLAASGDVPQAGADANIGNRLQALGVIASDIYQHFDPSRNVENRFVQYLENENEGFIVNINYGSLVITVKCSSLDVLERVWEDYCSDHLSEVAQKFLVTEKVLEDLGLVEIKLKTTISEEDYRACRNYFMKCGGSGYSGGKEERQREDGKEEEYRVFQHPADVRRNMSELPRPIRHFVNRKKELNEINNFLGEGPEDNCRCLLLHGAVGMGKTATAVKATNEMLETNSNTVAVYVNCRYVTSLDDLAGKIANQLYPLSEPLIEIKKLLITEEEFCTILLLDNFEFLLHLRESESSIEIQTERQFPTETSDIMEFVTDIATKSKKVYLLVTSSENVDFPHSGQQRIRLLPFNEDDSFQLLKKAYGDTPLEKETACKIAHFCGGIPLVLYSLASWRDNPSDLLEMLTNADPKEKFELFTRIAAATEDKKINVCLDACFNRLDANLQDTLVSLALFRGPFAMSKASEIFESAELSGAIEELAQRSFLEQHIPDPAVPCRYSILTVISLYCKSKTKETRFQKVLSDARKKFIKYILTFLERTFQSFLSTAVSKAIIAYRREDENVMQLIDWFGESGAMDEGQQKKCIDVFNEVGELLAKLMVKKAFDRAFTLLKNKCEELKDLTRLSECLTSLGIKEVFSCCCSPDLCDEAAATAKPYLLEADRIQSDLGISTGNSRAQCLAKLGRCLVKEQNFTEGKEKIQQAIDIRKAHGKDDTVMLGATYNDLAVALSLEAKHEEAIKVREKETLLIYREHLGDHPFTATILNNLSNNYCALDEYDVAKQYSEEALKIRRELLKDHYDTAKSLFDLGMVHKKREDFKAAKTYLRECESMQRVLDDKNMIMDLERTIKELEEDMGKRLMERVTISVDVGGSE